MKAHREVEHKYDVAADASVPDLLQLPEVGLVEPPHELTLEAVYFDTAEQDLTRAGVTLRRRTGGDDGGWHLKLPVGHDEREEIRSAIRCGAARTTVPKALRSLVQVHARGRALKPLATVRSRRVVHRLRAADGAVLADLCDDHVTAQVMREDGSATATAWWEGELVEGPPKLLSAADAQFLDACVLGPARRSCPHLRCSVSLSDMARPPEVPLGISMTSARRRKPSTCEPRGDRSGFRKWFIHRSRVVPRGSSRPGILICMRHAFLDQLDQIVADLVTMTGAVQRAVRLSTDALLHADGAAADDVIEGDARIDAQRERIEDESFELLALQQPVAGDLRMLIAAVRMVADLERMGDLAVHVAKVARLRAPHAALPPDVLPTIERMGELAGNMVGAAAGIIADRDIQAAAALERDDEEMDELRRRSFQVILGDTWSYGVEPAIDAALLGRYYERIADHAVSLGRRVVYLVTGAARPASQG